MSNHPSRRAAWGTSSQAAWRAQEAAKERAIDAVSAESWQHPAEALDASAPAMPRARGEVKPESYGGMIDWIVMPVIYQSRGGARLGVTRFVLMVEIADPSALEGITLSELARGLGTSTRLIERERDRLVAFGKRAKKDADLLRQLIPLLVPVTHHGRVRRWLSAFHGLVAFAYRVMPENFNGVTQGRLAKALGMTRRGLSKTDCKAKAALLLHRLGPR